MNALAKASLMTNTTRRRPNKRAPVAASRIAEIVEGIFPTENKLQNAVVKRLRPLEDALGFRVIAIPNGGYRKPREADQLKNRGVRAGFPDLMILAGTDIKRCTPTIFIELKQPDGKLSDEQTEWHTWLGDMLFPVHVCISVSSVLSVLRQYGLKV